MAAIFVLPSGTNTAVEVDVVELGSTGSAVLALKSEGAGKFMALGRSEYAFVSFGELSLFWTNFVDQHEVI